MDVKKAERVRRRYKELTSRESFRKSHEQAVKMLAEMLNTNTAEIEQALKETEPPEVKKLVEKLPDAVSEALRLAIVDYEKQHEVYFEAFKRVDEDLIELEKKIDDIRTFLQAYGEEV